MRLGLSYASTKPDETEIKPDPPTSSPQTQSQWKYKGLKVLLVTFTGFGLGLALTSDSLELRKHIESNVPYSNHLFQFSDSMYEKLIQQIITLKKLVSFVFHSVPRSHLYYFRFFQVIQSKSNPCPKSKTSSRTS